MRKTNQYSLVISFLFMCALIAACGNTASSSSTPASQSVPTQAPTSQSVPTQAPTSQPVPTKNPTSVATDILGASLGTFVAKFGQPNRFSTPNSGIYKFSIYGNNKTDVIVSIADSKHVDGVTQESPNNAGWSESAALATCLTYAPSDVVYQRQITQEDAQGNLQDIQRVYLSPSVAKEFPANTFTDENGNQTRPGTIGIILTYTHGSTTSFTECTTQVGLQAN